MTERIDEYTIQHLDAWLEHNVYPDYRERVKTQMLDFINDEPEYWLPLGWTRIYDNADCGDIT